MDLKKITDFALENNLGWLATVDNGTPRLRGWGLEKIENGLCYFATAAGKDVYDQLKAVPVAEWANFNTDTGVMLRLQGDVTFVEDFNENKALIDEFEFLKTIYPDDSYNTIKFFTMTINDVKWYQN